MGNVNEESQAALENTGKAFSQSGYNSCVCHMLGDGMQSQGSVGMGV